MIIELVLTLLVLILLRSGINFYFYEKRTNVPGPIPLPILGNAHLFLANTSEFLVLVERLAQKYGDPFKAYFFSTPLVFVSEPKFIEALMTSTEHITKGMSYTYLNDWLGQGLLTSTGTKWRTHRKFLTPAFHFNILQNFLPVFNRNGKILVEKLRNLSNGDNIDLFPIVALAALDNITESIMGVSLDVQKNSDSKYVTAIEEMAKLVSMQIQIPFLGISSIFNCLPLKTRQDKALSILHAQTRKVIADRRKDLEKMDIKELTNNSEIGIKNKHAFLDLLLLAEVNGKSIDDESIKNEVDTFMFEGHDTTTSGIVYTLLCIAENKQVQERLFEEQKSIFGNDMERDATFSELHQMKYMDLVIREAFRLYPPVPLIERKITRDTEIAGLRVIKNTSVTMNIYQLQRNPDIYENPLEFRPERFENNTTLSAFSWVAFSAGPRNCIGQKFALMEVKVTISEIIRNFKLLPSGVEPKLCAELVLRSLNGVQVKLLRRE